MKKRKHKFHVGQLIKVRDNSYAAYKRKYGYIIKLVSPSIYPGSIDMPEYDIIIQGQPNIAVRLFENEIKAVE